MPEPPLAPLVLIVGKGLSFELSGFPEALAAPVRTFFGHFLDPGDHAPDDALPIVVVYSGGPTPGAEDPILLEEPPMTIRGNAEGLLFELPGVCCRCEATDDRATVFINDPSVLPIPLFTSWMLVTVLLVLGQRRGWIGLHAAAVEVEGTAVLLPASSGCGKSTLHRQANEHGLGVLSDDLVWVYRKGETFNVRAFQRRAEGSCDPAPTIDDLPLGHIVVPSIKSQGPSLLTPLPEAQAARELMAQATFLPGGPRARQHFGDLVAITRSVPCLSLAAGPAKDAIPTLMQRLAGDGVS